MPVDPQHEKGREAWERLAADLEARLKRLRTVVVGLTALCLAMLAAGFGIYTGRLEIPARLSPDEVIKVRGMVVVDDHGTPRLQIGSPLPDPPILGKRRRMRL